MKPEKLRITSLRQALERAMEEPTTATRRGVVVHSVHVAHAGAVLKLLRFQERRGRWKVHNAGRLVTLTSLDYLLSAVANDLLPALVVDPTSQPTLALLSCYARYVKAWASAVGGTFFDDAPIICDRLIGHAAIAMRRPLQFTVEEVLRRTNDVLHGLRHFRSCQVVIADADPAPDSDLVIDSDDSDLVIDSDDSGGGVPFLEVSLISLRQAVQKVIAADRRDTIEAVRVTIETVRVKDSSPLLGVVVFQATTYGWDVRNLHSISALVSIDGCFEAIGRGLMRILQRNPGYPAALRLLRDLASGFEKYAAGMLDELLRHATTAPLKDDMLEKTHRIRQSLAMFRCRCLSISTDSDSSASDTDASSIDTTMSDASTTAPPPPPTPPPQA